MAVCASGLSNHALRARLRRKGIGSIWGSTLAILTSGHQLPLLLLVLPTQRPRVTAQFERRQVCENRRLCQNDVPRCSLCWCMLKPVMLDETVMLMLLVITSAPIPSSCVEVTSVTVSSTDRSCFLFPSTRQAYNDNARLSHCPNYSECS